MLPLGLLITRSYCITLTIQFLEELVILPRIISLMHTVLLSSEIHILYKHLTLANPKFDTPTRVDMLISGDIFPYLVRSRGEILHTIELPSALATLLWWVVFAANSKSLSALSGSLTITSTPSINELLHNFLTVE